MIELTGSGSKLDSFIQAIDADLILETVRPALAALAAATRILKKSDPIFAGFIPTKGIMKVYYDKDADLS